MGLNEEEEAEISKKMVSSSFNPKISNFVI